MVGFALHPALTPTSLPGPDPMRRFFIDPEQITGDTAILTGRESRHLTMVLRLQPGSRVQLFDGTGREYLAEIIKLDRGNATLAILETKIEEQPHGPALYLGQALLKSQKMDLIIQKATELGVAGLLPVNTRFCVQDDISENRVRRWQRIAREACKQCNRPRPLQIAPPASYADLIAESGRFILKLLFWEQETMTRLGSILPPANQAGPVLVLVGPEGGFSNDEVELAQKTGFQTVTLGRRILRAETASLAATSIVQHLMGNLE